MEFNGSGLRSAVLGTALWSTESRSNRGNFWFLMRVQTDVHHDPIGYACTPGWQMDGWMDGRMDGWMDGWMDTTRTILLTQLSAEPKTNIVTITCSDWPIFLPIGLTGENMFARDDTRDSDFLNLLPAESYINEMFVLDYFKIKVVHKRGR
jgi:hypothetical protein